MSAPRRDDVSSTAYPPIEELVAEFICLREEGARPSLDALMARYPRYAEELARLLAYETVPPTRDEGVPAPAPSERETGRVGPYEILEHVSTAGGGTVYRARHAATGRVVALKTLDGRGALDGRD
ncbi:MAG TPA: hypothetical protein VEI02_02420, partial [Planctomycetota bacterium]|nr:hypothetical protein [Planctomycetota bacterium]